MNQIVLIINIFNEIIIFLKSEDKGLVLVTNFPQIGLIITPCRSGSTPLVNSLCQTLKGIYEPFRAEFTYQNKPELTYDFFRSQDDSELHPFIKKNPNSFIVLKEAISQVLVRRLKTLNDFFPSKESNQWENTIKRAKPVFLFRNPVDTYNSLKKRVLKGQGEWDDLGMFIKTYKETFDFYKKLKKEGFEVYCLTYEHLTNFPNIVLQELSKKWQFTFSKKMIQWTQPFGENKNIYSERGQIVRDGKVRNFHEGIAYSMGLSTNNISDLATSNYLSDIERQDLEKTLGGLYKDLLQASKVDFGIPKKPGVQSDKVIGSSNEKLDSVA